MRALLDRVLVQETTTEGDAFIWTPENDRMNPKRGIVMSVGDRVEQLAIGDPVIFPEQAAIRVPVGNGHLHLLSEHQILGVLEEGE